MRCRRTFHRYGPVSTPTEPMTEDIQLVADACVFRYVAGWKEDFSLVATIEIQTEINFLYDAKAIVIAEFYLFCHIILFSRI